VTLDLNSSLIPRKVLSATVTPISLEIATRRSHQWTLVLPSQLKKVLLRNLDFFIFSHSLPLPGRLSLLSNAIVVCCLLSSFPLEVRHPILHVIVFRCLHRLQLLSSAVAVIVVYRCRCPPLPSSAVAAVIATLCLHRLLPPALVLPLYSLRPNLACRCRPPLLLSASAVVVCCRILPPLQPSSPLHCLCRLSPSALVLLHCSPPPNHASCCCPPLSSSATVVVCHHRTSTRLPSYKMLIVA
jgi:hypothetical protein